MKQKIRQLFEQNTVPNFTPYDSNIDGILADHWETFQEGFEAAVKECAKFCESEDSLLLAKMLKERFGVE